MSLGHVFAKLLSIGSQVNVWHQTVRTHNACHTSLQLLEQGPQLVLGQLVILAYHSRHLPNTQNAFYKHLRLLSGRWQCLVLVGWPGNFVCRLEWNKTSGCYLQPHSRYFVSFSLPKGLKRPEPEAQKILAEGQSSPEDQNF